MVAILTIHGWGYWALWLWEGIYPRGLYWDAYGSNMLSGALSWGAGAALWFTSLSFIRRKYFEVHQIWLLPHGLLYMPAVLSALLCALHTAAHKGS